MRSNIVSDFKKHIENFLKRLRLSKKTTRSTFTSRKTIVFAIWLELAEMKNLYWCSCNSERHNFSLCGNNIFPEQNKLCGIELYIQQNKNKIFCHNIKLFRCIIEIILEKWWVGM